MTNALNRAIYGRPTGKDSPGIIGYSQSLTPETIELWRQWVTLHPLPATTAAGSVALGVFESPDHQYLVVRATTPDPASDTPVYEYVYLTRRDLQALSGNLRLLLDLFDEPLPVFTDYNTPIEPAYLTATPTWTFDKRLNMLNSLLADYAAGDIQVVFALLGAAIDPRGLLIRGFQGNYERRLELVQALMLLLPSTSRPDITFSTHIRDSRTAEGARARIVFVDDGADDHPSERWVADFERRVFPDDSLFGSQYLDCLQTIWNGDPKSFIAEVRSMELLTTQHGENGSGMSDLDQIARRYLQDRRALAGEPLDMADILATLADERVTGELRIAYLRLLLEHALETRDHMAVTLVTQAMDSDEAVDAALSETLGVALETHPDAVYVLARERLRHGIDARWLPRIHLAAVAALAVAIRDADADTLVNWLKLIAREPDGYALGDVLHKGLLDARSRAYNDGQIGYQLILLAAKHAPELVDTLLEDEQLLNALPDTPRRALREYAPAAIMEVAKQGREIFLILIGRAVRSQVESVLTPEFLAELWAIHIDTPSADADLPTAYRTQTIIDTLIYTGTAWLDDSVRYTLLTLMLTDRHDELFLSLTRRMDQIDEYALAEGIHQSKRPPVEIVALMAQAVLEEIISLQQAVSIYAYLLDADGWRAGDTVLAEQIARHFQQSPSLSLPPDTLRRLLGMATDNRSEQIARSPLKRLLAEMERHEEDNQIVRQVIALWEQLSWSASLQAQILAWWRDYVRLQPLARLQNFDKGLDGKKPLEDARSIVQTTIALRRMLGKRSLEDFADAVANAYTVLQALSEAFDPVSRQPLDFDPETARAELENRQGELTPDEKKVLAKNLRELGGIIALMAEHRSKASLIRREGDVERQLISGGQLPHSAIDMMRWLSGYLDGAHHHDSQA